MCRHCRVVKQFSHQFAELSAGIAEEAAAGVGDAVVLSPFAGHHGGRGREVAGGLQVMQDWVERAGSETIAVGISSAMIAAPQTGSLAAWYRTCIRTKPPKKCRNRSSAMVLHRDIDFRHCSAKWHFDKG